MGGGGAVLATATICCSIVINRIISCFGSVFGVQESPPSSSAVSPCARPVGFCRIADRLHAVVQCRKHEGSMYPVRVHGGISVDI